MGFLKEGVAPSRGKIKLDEKMCFKVIDVRATQTVILGGARSVVYCRKVGGKGEAVKQNMGESKEKRLKRPNV